jgi:RNase H-fold protein (predicted Holliday junction resolvase)
MKAISSINLLLVIISIKSIYSNIFKKVLNLISPKEEEEEKNMINIFIATHRDFENYRYNQSYKIITSSPKMQKNYSIEVIYCDENSRLKSLDRAYGEMAKIYKAYSLYKSGQMSSKYVGINHYRRYFGFLDNIPNMDDIFKDYDLVLKDKYVFYYGKTLKENYCLTHICKNFEEMIDIIKELRPEYYQAALNASNMEYIFPANIFIMKKEDFIKYGDFMFQILFEFDKRHNFKSDQDVEKYVKKNYNRSDVMSQTRLQGYLAERISNIFYMKNFNFERIKIMPVILGTPRNEDYNKNFFSPSRNEEMNITLQNKTTDEIKIKKKQKINLLKIIVHFIIFILIFFSIYRIYKNMNKIKYNKRGKRRIYKKENFNFEKRTLIRRK